jgi:threonyl-tRNA synthetase
VYIEHTVGKFPVWLAPEQVRIATVNQTDEMVAYAAKLEEQAKQLGLRVAVDNSNESVGKKIRQAEQAKVPYMLVIGEKEMESGIVLPRIRKDIDVDARHLELTFEEFAKTVANEAKSRVQHSSL